jgi:hypothetical protein
MMRVACDLHSGTVASSARTKPTVMRRRGRAGYVRSEGALVSSTRPGEQESTPCEADVLMIPVASHSRSEMRSSNVRTKQTATRRGGRAGTVRSDGALVILTQPGEHESTPWAGCVDNACNMLLLPHNTSLQDPASAKIEENRRGPCFTSPGGARQEPGAGGYPADQLRSTMCVMARFYFSRLRIFFAPC